MATQRYISTSFWDDAWVQSIDPSEKLLYLYLLTNPLTNIAGIYTITDKRIHDDTGFNLDMIKILIARFEAAKKAYRCGEYIIIPSWPKHQKWQEKKTIESGIRKILAELPNSIRDKAKRVGYLYPIDTVPIAYGYSPSYSDPDLHTDTDTDLTYTPPADDDTPPEPEPTASPSANAVAKKPVDPLYQAIWQSFKAKTPIMANYAAQGAATHRLVAFIRQHSDKDDPDSAPELAKQVVTKYWNMTQGRDKFWSKQPFTPMNLAAAGILDRVIQELRTAEKQQEPDGFIPF